MFGISCSVRALPKTSDSELSNKVLYILTDYLGPKVVNLLIYILPHKMQYSCKQKHMLLFQKSTKFKFANQKSKAIAEY